jgi:hypothetical protein
MEVKTFVKLTKEEKIALIKAYEILSELNEYVCYDDTPLSSVGDVLHDLSLIMDSLSVEYNVN